MPRTWAKAANTLSRPPSFGEPPVYTYRATVRRVIDGDTLVVDIDLGFNLLRTHETLRLNGIDTKEKELGSAAKAAVSQLCPFGEPIILTTIKDRKDKYGRYLAVVTLSDGSDLAKVLIDRDLAVPYSGGKRNDS